MPYRPKFCCECGDKIERVEWKLWTNRRFCEVCEAEHKLNDLIPKAGAGLGLLLGLVGLGSFFQKPLGSEAPVIRRVVTASARPPDTGETGVKAGPSNQSNVSTPPAAVAGNVKTVQSDSRPINQTVTSLKEPVYMCGARTKKGTPCTRRVKGNVRCWQHTGMPAMEAPEKLVVNR